MSSLPADYKAFQIESLNLVFHHIHLRYEIFQPTDSASNAVLCRDGSFENFLRGSIGNAWFFTSFSINWHCFNPTEFKQVGNSILPLSIGHRRSPDSIYSLPIRNLIGLLYESNPFSIGCSGDRLAFIMWSRQGMTQYHFKNFWESTIFALLRPITYGT